MTMHYVVESMSAYEAARLQGAASWHTTSPAILDILSRKEEDVHSLDAGVPYPEADRLARAGYRFAEHYGEYLNQECRWRDHADLALIFGAAMAKLFHVIFYKAKALDALLNRVAPEKVVCVGDPDTVKVKGLNWTYNRFDTLYAYLASQVSLDRLFVLHHEIPPDDLRDSTRNAIPQRMGYFEKCMSLLNNTFSSFAFKLWRSLLSRKLYLFRHICLRPFPSRTFYIYKTCELIEERFLALLCNGGKVGFLGKLPHPTDNPGIEALHDSQTITGTAADMMQRSLQAEGFAWRPLFHTASVALAGRLGALLGNFQANKAPITRKFDQLLNSFSTHPVIITNALSWPIERFFYCHCSKRNIPVIAFEHGVTLGLSEFSDWSVRHTGMIAADAGVYHNEQARRAVNSFVPNQKSIVAGLPRITSSIILPAVQRYLSRRWLNLGSADHAVIYVADIEHNNYIYGPYADNDLQYKEKTEAILSALSARYPNSRLFLKLYPAARYIENHRFETFCTALPNAVVIRDMDFRFIRAAADLIVATSSQSTLGWCCGSIAPTWFLEFEWSPAYVTGQALALEPVKGLMKAVQTDISRIASIETTRKALNEFLFGITLEKQSSQNG